VHALFVGSLGSAVLASEMTMVSSLGFGGSRSETCGLQQLLRALADDEDARSPSGKLTTTVSCDLSGSCLMTSALLLLQHEDLWCSGAAG